MTIFATLLEAQCDVKPQAQRESDVFWMLGMDLQDACSAMADPHAPRVLLIDDDPGVREAVSSLLVSFGYDCQTADDGESGLIRFDEGGWDLVLTDLVMPTVSGWDVVKAIRRRAPRTPVLLITGLSDPAVMQRAREWRVPVIAKPFRLETFKATLIEALYAQTT